MCELKGGFPVNGIASVNPMQRMGTSNLLYCVVLTMEMNGMNKRGYKIKGPTEMHYTAIPTGTSKVNSSRFTVTLTSIHDYSIQFRFTEICFYKVVILHRSFHWSFVLFEFILGWKVAQRALFKKTKKCQSCIPW